MNRITTIIHETLDTPIATEGVLLFRQLKT